MEDGKYIKVGGWKIYVGWRKYKGWRMEEI